MTVTPIVRWTAGSTLYGEDVVAGLRGKVSDPSISEALEGRLGAVGGMAVRAIQQNLPAVIADFVNLDLGTVVLAAWRKHRDLVEAARVTLDPASGSQQVPVPLATHDIVLTQRPSVDALLAGQVLLTLRLELTVTITVIGAEAVVRRGALTEVRGGALEVKVAFSGQGIDLGRVTRSIEARLLLPLGHGVPLTVPSQRDGKDSAG
jgi:hypothetical protein